MVLDMTPLGVGPSLEHIVGLFRERKSLLGADIARMSVLRDQYNGDVVVPLPEMDRNEESAVANIIATGLNQTAMRIASTLPNIYYPPLDNSNNASINRARTRTLANKGWWTANDMSGKLRLRSRKLIGYASSPVSLRPNMKTGAPLWQLRDPLSCFPSTPDDATDMTPENCIFSYQRTRGWVKVNYPEQLTYLSAKLLPRNQWDAQGERAIESPEDKFTVLEYQDPECTVLLILAMDSGLPNKQGLPFVQLERTVNRTGMTLVVTPGRFTLDRQLGQYDGLVGMNQAMAKLFAMEMIFAGKSVFPSKYLISNPNETASFAAGPYPASSGMVNIIKDGTMHETPVSGGFAGSQMVSNLERNMRVEGGISPEMGGESQSNVRTGKRGDSIMAAVIDFPVQEAQEILAASLEHENKRGVAIVKNYFGNEKRSFYITAKGSSRGQGHVDYIPNKDFETDNNVVTYPQTGVDANGLVTGGGQRVAMGTMSKRTFMFNDPAIDDPEQEWKQIEEEQIQAAIVAGLTQKLQTGEIPVSDGALIMQMVAKGTPIQDAIVEVQKKAQERQAAQVPAGTAPTQPGLSMPGMGAEQPAIPQQGPSQQNLAQILSSIGTNAKGA
jgi:hypothetical protein